MKGLHSPANFHKLPIRPFPFEMLLMKSDIHPTLHQTKVTCSCGATYTISGTLKELRTEICMKCHPHYTGTKKLLDTEGRVDKFMSKFKGKTKK